MLFDSAEDEEDDARGSDNASHDEQKRDRRFISGVFAQLHLDKLDMAGLLTSVAASNLASCFVS